MKIPIEMFLLWSSVLLTFVKTKNDTDSTKAYDKSCGPQDELITKCVSFTKERCLFVNSFAPVANNLYTKVGYRSVNHTMYITLFILWKVPEQGVSKETLWGWQLRVIGKTGMVAGKKKCIQINRKDILKQVNKMLTNVKFENQTVLLPPVPASYTVEVQGLPSWHGPHSKTVVTTDVNIIPDWCILHGSYPCCDYHTDNSYNFLNTNLLVDESNKSATMTWNTSFPRNLNISIEGYILKWISHPNDVCHANATVLLLHRSNFTFPKLRKNCGKYLLIVEVIFKNPEQVGCKYSPGVTIIYNPNRPSSVTTTPNPSASNTALTVGFAVSACVIAIIIVLFITLKHRERVKARRPQLEQLIPDYHDYVKDFVKAFILTPNHCNVCKDVVHKLATLLMTTGRISCVVDMFVPNNEKQGGPVKWGERMIKESEYVLIPWLTSCSQTDPSCTTRSDMNVKTFNLLLETILGQRLADPNSKRKLVPVYLDHCDIDVIPSNQRILNIYSLPSNVDDLILDLIGETSRRLDGTQVQFNDKKYQNAKEALQKSVERMKNHQCDKNLF